MRHAKARETERFVRNHLDKNGIELSAKQVMEKANDLIDKLRKL
jgi:hypothetical protein